MSVQLLKRLGIGLVVLVVLWGGVEVLRSDVGDGFTQFALPQISIDDLDSVVIDRTTESIVLARAGDAWTASGHRASASGVSDLVDALGEDLRAELVARNASSHARFNLDPGQRRRLRLYQGGPAIVDLFVGKRGRDFQTVYLRRPNEDAVYVARTQIVSFVDRPLNDWRDKVLTAFPADTIVEIEIRRGNSSYTVARGDSASWTINGEAADSAQAARLFGQFEALNATGFPTEVQMDSVDLANAERGVILRDRSSNILTELVFDSTATSAFWVRRSGDSTIMRLDRFRVDQLTPADTALAATSRDGNSTG